MPPDEVRVGGDLPAGEVDRVEARLHHLHRLAARHRAERRDPLALGEQRPEARCAEPRERVLDVHRAAQPVDVGGRVGAMDGVGHVLASFRIQYPVFLDPKQDYRTAQGAYSDYFGSKQ